MTRCDNDFKPYMRQRLYDYVDAIHDFDLMDIFEKFLNSRYGEQFSLGGSLQVASSYYEMYRYINHWCGGYIPKTKDWDKIIFRWMCDIYYVWFTVFGYTASETLKVVTPRELYSYYNPLHETGNYNAIVKILNHKLDLEVNAVNGDLVKINSFKEGNFFLSNFYTADVTYDGITYKNNEAAFQAQKCINKNDRLKFKDLNPSEAKKLGRSVNLRKDWEEIKISVMHDIVKAKFLQNSDLKEKLLLTGDVYLEEGNNWGDKVWGTVNGQGANNLGKILMKVREELRISS